MVKYRAQIQFQLISGAPFLELKMYARFIVEEISLKK